MPLAVLAIDAICNGFNQPKASMFYFHHPKPFIQKAVAVMIAQRRTEPLPDNKVLVVEIRKQVIAPPEPSKEE